MLDYLVAEQITDTDGRDTASSSERSSFRLTVRAVLAPPALQAAAAPVVIAGVVAKGVVAGPAVGGAGLTVVVLSAHYVVGVTQLALVAKVHVLGPLLPDGQPAAGRQPADEVVLVLWVNEGGDGDSFYCVRSDYKRYILKMC